MLLHDGAPNGYREFQGQDVPVFDELALLERSAYETWTLEVVAPAEEDVDDLVERLRAIGVPAEDWTRTVRNLCAKCDTGVPHAHHNYELAPAWGERRSIAVAVDNKDIAFSLTAWSSAKHGRSYSSPTRAA